METRFICLANSSKEGGRCIAGIEVDANNNPILKDNKPKWIRPVCNTAHGEIPTRKAQAFQLLNIIQLDVTACRPQGHQSENVAFRENSVKSMGSFDRNRLGELCSTTDLIFGNRGKAIAKENINALNHSLSLILVEKFEVDQQTLKDRPDKISTRLIFTFNGIQYDFPITDPAFLHQYLQNRDVLQNVSQLYLCLSLGIEWQNWYYKLVAGIIY